MFFISFYNGSFINIVVSFEKKNRNTTIEKKRKTSEAK